ASNLEAGLCYELSSVAMRRWAFAQAWRWSRRGIAATEQLETSQGTLLRVALQAITPNVPEDFDHESVDAALASLDRIEPKPGQVLRSASTCAMHRGSVRTARDLLAAARRLERTQSPGLPFLGEGTLFNLAAILEQRAQIERAAGALADAEGYLRRAVEDFLRAGNSPLGTSVGLAEVLIERGEPDAARAILDDVELQDASGQFRTSVSQNRARLALAPGEVAVARGGMGDLLSLLPSTDRDAALFDASSTLVDVTREAWLAQRGGPEDLVATDHMLKATQTAVYA